MALPVCGCARNEIRLIDLDFRRMPEAAPLIERVSAPVACWWTEAGKIQIAAARQGGPPRQPGGRVADFSLVLAGMPAGGARDYALNPQSLRGYVRGGGRHARYRSLRGLASIWMRPGERLRVRFRVIAQKETFHILTGWTAVGETVLVGEFLAHQDARIGGQILARSERDGMTRTRVVNTTPGVRPRPVQVIGLEVKPSDE